MMDGDGSGFSFPSASDYTKGPDATDVSWADIFLDGIHSDDPTAPDPSNIISETPDFGSSFQGSTHQMLYPSQPGVVGEHLQIRIPTHIQGSLTNSGVQQAGAGICGTVTYLAPSASTHQHGSTTDTIHNVMAVPGHHQVAAPVGQHQHPNSSKLLQFAPSFPMSTNILQPTQAVSSQAIYGGQGGGLFPTQGSVHIENPKVVNVNFGPHVIGSGGTGQQAIIQSFSLTQPLMGTQLINPVGNNVIRTSLAPGIMPSSAAAPRQIVLPSGQAVIPQQANSQYGGIAKNVVLSPNVSPIIYQGGQGGQLIHSQPTTLIASSGQGLHVVNASGSQGSQVQLIGQSSINQTGMEQQQGSVMSLINNSGVLLGTGSQITGLMPGQNILVNGQMLSIGQLGSLTVPQLHVQQDPQGNVTLADVNTTVTTCTAPFQPTAPHLVYQQKLQQQHKDNNTTHSPLINSPTQRIYSGLSSNINGRTPTPSSASSTPVLTPTPSTPTPAPTPELLSDFSEGKSNQSMNILKQALDMSDIDLQSFEEDISFLDDDSFSSITAQQHPFITKIPPIIKQTLQPLNKTKTYRGKRSTDWPLVNTTVGGDKSVRVQQPAPRLQNTSGHQTPLQHQQKIVTPNGDVFIISANGQQLFLQPVTSNSASPAASYASSLNRTNISISSTPQLKNKLPQDHANQGCLKSNIGGQINFNTHYTTTSLQQKNPHLIGSSQTESKDFIVTASEATGVFKMEATPLSQSRLSTASQFGNSTVVSRTSAALNQNIFPVKSQKISTLGGAFLNQEQRTPVIKQETFRDIELTRQGFQDNIEAKINTHSSSGFTSHSFTTMTSTSISSSLTSLSFSEVAVTTTTQSHQSIIMSTAQTSGNWQTCVSTTSDYVPPSLSPFQETYPASTNTGYRSQDVHSGSHAMSPMAGTKSNSKEKDPGCIKAIIPIKIADTTLMLSLTPVQKEKLEAQLSRMSKKEQELFLVHQQSEVRRSQQARLKQLEQQLEQQQLQKQLLQQQVGNRQHQGQGQQFQHQTPPALPTEQFSYQQALSPPNLTPSAQLMRQSELMSPQTREPAQIELNPIFQELMDTPEGDENFQAFPSLQTQEQPPQLHQTQPRQFSDLQQQANSQQRSAPPIPSGGSAQPFVSPQMGRCLAEQQLMRDCSLAIDPDISTPFLSPSDALRRLVRYHTLQDHKPDMSSKPLRIWDARYSKLCDYLMKKKRCYLRRYKKMKLYYDMCPEKQPEYIQNLICFNEHLRDLMEREKEAAKCNPDFFPPVKSGHTFTNWPFTSVKASLGSPDNLDSCFSSGKSDWLHATMSSEKGQFLDKNSSGMLKLVFKRGRTDNFSVKKSLTDTNELPQGLRPYVDLEKSDSEYEFDFKPEDVVQNQPVKVRRRTLSLLSRPASFDTDSDINSVSSRTEEVYDISSEEEDETDDNSEGEDDDDKTIDDDNGDHINEYVADTRRLKQEYSISFNSNADETDTESYSTGDDSFKESEMTAKDQIGCYKVSKAGDLETSFFQYKNESCSGAGNLNIRSELLYPFSQNTSLASHNASGSSEDIYSGSLSDTRSTAHSQTGTCDSFSCGKATNYRVFSLETVTDNGRLSQMLLSDEEDDCILVDPVGDMKMDSSQFTLTSNSSLTRGGMFISERGDIGTTNSQMVPAYGRDLQNIMTADSDRSVINFFDDEKGSQTSWASSSSSQNRPSSSLPTVHQGLYRLPSTISQHSQDSDLYASVRGVMNS